MKMNEQNNHMDIDSLINSISETESWKKLKNNKISNEKNEVKLSVYQKFIEIKKLIKKICMENNLNISNIVEFIQRLFDESNIIEEIEIGANYLELRYKNAEITSSVCSYEPVLKYKTVLLQKSQNYTRVTLYKLMFNLPNKVNEGFNKKNGTLENKNTQNTNFNNRHNSNITNNFGSNNFPNTSNNLNNQYTQTNQYINKNPILTDPANEKQIQLIYKLLRKINQKENAYKYIKENFHINRSSELKNISIEQAEIITKQLEKIKKKEKFQSLKQQHGMNTNEIKELENISKQNNQNNPNDQVDSKESNIETLDKLNELPNIEEFNQIRKNIGNKEAVKNESNDTNESIEQNTSSQLETIEVIDDEIIDLSSI